jgi:hypothetical protein
MRGWRECRLQGVLFPPAGAADSWLADVTPPATSCPLSALCHPAYAAGWHSHDH